MKYLALVLLFVSMLFASAPVEAGGNGFTAVRVGPFGFNRFRAPVRFVDPFAVRAFRVEQFNGFNQFNHGGFNQFNGGCNQGGFQQLNGGVFFRY